MSFFWHNHFLQFGALDSVLGISDNVTVLAIFKIIQILFCTLFVICIKEIFKYWEKIYIFPSKIDFSLNYILIYGTNYIFNPILTILPYYHGNLINNKTQECFIISQQIITFIQTLKSQFNLSFCLCSAPYSITYNCTCLYTDLQSYVHYVPFQTIHRSECR